MKEIDKKALLKAILVVFAVVAESTALGFAIEKQTTALIVLALAPLAILGLVALGIGVYEICKDK